MVIQTQRFLPYYENRNVYRLDFVDAGERWFWKKKQGGKLLKIILSSNVTWCDIYFLLEKTLCKKNEELYLLKSVCVMLFFLFCFWIIDNCIYVVMSLIIFLYNVAMIWMGTLTFELERDKFRHSILWINFNLNKKNKNIWNFKRFFDAWKMFFFSVLETGKFYFLTIETNHNCGQ